MMRKYSVIFLTLCTIVSINVGCNRFTSIKTLSLPSTSIISSTDRFALVLDPYISLRDQPGDTGITIGHGRRGEIYPISGKKIILSGKVNTIWINLGKGWTNESSVRFFSNRGKAETAALLLK